MALMLSRIILVVVLLFSFVEVEVPLVPNAHAQQAPLPAAHPYSFQPAQLLEHVVGFDLNPATLQLSNGSLWVAWDSNRYGTYQIYLKSWNGNIWSGDLPLTSSSSNTYPSLAQFSDGTIILVWTSNASGYDNLYYKTFNGGGWSAAIPLTSGAFYDESAKIAIAPGPTLWVVWERDTPTGPSTPMLQQVYYKRLTGNVWSDDTLLTASSLFNIEPGVMVSKRGLVWVSWASSVSQGGPFKILDVTFNGTQWSNNMTLTNPNPVLTKCTSCDSQPGMVQDRNGTVWLFWARQMILNSTQSQTEIFYKYSGDVGKTWTKDVELTFGGDPNNPISALTPSAVQSIDTRLWLFHSSNAYLSDFDIYYVTTLNILPVADIAVTSIQVTPLKTYPYGDAPTNIATITVTVSNIGDLDTYVTLTVQATNKTTYVIGTLSDNITAGASRNFIFNWNTLSIPPGRYTLTASAPPVAGETLGNAVENSLTFKSVTVLLPGDLDKNGCVSIIDAGMMGKAYGSTPTRGYWNPDADLDNNGVITIIDFGILAARYSKCV